MGRARGKTELGDITKHNIKQLKYLNQAVFPVSYNDRFYKDVLELGELVKLAYFNDVVVGAVCCRIDLTEGKRRLYIMTLGCLPCYRKMGIGTTMLNHVLDICEKDDNFHSVYLHVQISNEVAIKFYEKCGFVIVDKKESYYKRIEPADAFVLEKVLGEAVPAEPLTIAVDELESVNEPNDLSDSEGKRDEGEQIVDDMASVGEQLREIINDGDSK